MLLEISCTLHQRLIAFLNARFAANIWINALLRKKSIENERHLGFDGGV